MKAKVTLILNLPDDWKGDPDDNIMCTVWQSVVNHLHVSYLTRAMDWMAEGIEDPENKAIVDDYNMWANSLDLPKCEIEIIRDEKMKAKVTLILNLPDDWKGDPDDNITTAVGSVVITHLHCSYLERKLDWMAKGIEDPNNKAMVDYFDMWAKALDLHKCEIEIIRDERSEV